MEVLTLRFSTLIDEESEDESMELYAESKYTESKQSKSSVLAEADEIDEIDEQDTLFSDRDTSSIDEDTEDIVEDDTEVDDYNINKQILNQLCTITDILKELLEQDNKHAEEFSKKIDDFNGKTNKLAKDVDGLKRQTAYLMIK